jgi:hypothetical protein
LPIEASISGMDDAMVIRTDNSDRVHYVILTRRPLEGSAVVGWPDKIVDQPTCGGVPHGRGSRYLL